jgi:MFS family permease
MILRRNKRLLFAMMGAIGGLSGAVMGELVNGEYGSILAIVAFTGLWAGMAGALIAVALACAGEIYHRKEQISMHIIWPSLRSGFIAGVVAGAIAQVVFAMPILSDSWLRMVFQAGCWGVMGGMLGLGFARFMPNMSRTKGFLGGIAGGMLGGALFLGASMFLPDLVGRLLGLSILGAALGLCLVVAEECFRHAALEVIWAPNETTTITLGTRPVYLGGGDDHIYIAGLPQHAVSVVVENQKILCRQHGSLQPVVLKNGSTINVGRVKLVVRASA